MQEIAAEAGVNQALLHYYFRNKEQLARRRRSSARRAASCRRSSQVIASDGELEEKVRRVIDLELDHLSRAPYLPGYIIGEVHAPSGARRAADRRGHRARRRSDLGPRVLGTLRRQIDARGSRPAPCGRSRPSRSSST